MLQQVTPGLHVSVGTLSATNGVAAFDLDWTLIRTVKGRFPKDENDWAFLPHRLTILKAYRDAGYTLVIFTNQGYKGAKLVTAIARVNNVITALVKDGIQPFVFAATGDGSVYRKPGAGMWQVFLQYLQRPVDFKNSVYVGDAAGRPEDHSADDIQFAQAVGLTFHTPEEIFPVTQVDVPDTQAMFIFVGMPGSGKSSYYEKYLQPLGWVHANQDILKTRPKLLSTIATALASGRSVAVDATNPDPAKRRDYTMLAIQYQVPTIILYFVANGYDRNKLRPHPVPDIAYNMYFKNLVEPSKDIDGVTVVEMS